MVVKKIYLIRHGETQWNIEKRSQGAEADIPLNETGIIQSKKTGLYLHDYRIKSKQFDAIYSSPQKRALETAEIIKKELNLHKDIILLDDLKETKSGKFSGTTKEDRLKNPLFINFMNALRKFEEIKDPIEKENFNYHILDKEAEKLGYETIGEAHEKGKKICDELIMSSHQKIIVVTHSGTIGAILKYITNSLDPCNGNTDNGSNCTISYIKWIDDKFQIITYPNSIHIGLYKNIAIH